MKYKDFLKSDIAKLFYLYTISYILIIINFEGIYWDDWVLYNNDNDVVVSIFKMNGNLLKGYVHNILLSIGNGVFIYRILMFITFFLSGLYIYKILKKSGDFFQDIAFWISAIYLLIPLNSAKIALINTPSIFLLFFFFLSFYMLVSYLNNERKYFLYRLLILGLFFISFIQTSHLVFYAIVLIYIFYHILKSENKKFLYLIKEYFLKYSDFILLPIVFFVIKKIYLTPYDLYAGYNKINLDIYLIANLIKTSFLTSIYEPIYVSIKNGLHLWYIFLPILTLILLFTKNKKIKNKKFYYYIVLFFIGMLFYILAVFPYATVGKLPHLRGWESRHQILMPLGVAFILYSIIAWFSKINKHIPVLLFSIFIAFFMVQNIYNGYRYIQDWYYQIALEENFKTSKEIKSHSTFVARVKLRDVLANGRELSFYEQNGRMKKVFGKDNKFIVNNINEIEMYKQYKPYKQYNFSSWEYQRPIFIQITKNKLYENNMPYFLKMFYYQFVDKDMFRKMAKQLIFIKIGRNSVK